IQMNRSPEIELTWVQVNEALQCELPDKQSQQTAAERKQDGLGQQLPGNACAGRAKRDASCDLTRTGCGAGEEDARYVHATNEEHKRHCAPHQLDVRSDIAGEPGLQRDSPL